MAGLSVLTSTSRPTWSRRARIQSELKPLAQRRVSQAPVVVGDDMESGLRNICVIELHSMNQMVVMSGRSDTNASELQHRGKALAGDPHSVERRRGVQLRVVWLDRHQSLKANSVHLL